MANIKISQLPAKGANLASADLLEVSEFTGTGYVSKSITGQEIIDAIPAGAAVNPTSGVMPYNDSGSFVDSGFSYSGPAGLEKTLLEHNDTFATTLKLNTLNDEFTFGRATSGGISTSATSGLALLTISSSFSLGNASTSGSGVSASWGMALDANIGEAIIGVGMSSPSNGVFRASSASGNVWVGTYGESWGVGFHGNAGTMFLGSSLVTPASPSNPTTPVAWYNITNEFGVQFFAPLYQ